MDKVIHYQIAISPMTRQSQPIQYEFYSHDRNNAKLTFTLSESLTDTAVTALFYFKRSQAKWETTGTVDGSTVTVKFDTTLITQDENVIGYLYFKKNNQEADVFQFRFAVKLSRIDRDTADKAHRIDNKQTIDLKDYVTKIDLEERLKKLTIDGGRYDDTDILRRLAELEKRIVTPIIDDHVSKKIDDLASKLEAKITTSEALQLISGKLQHELTSYASQSEVEKLSRTVSSLPKGKLGNNLLANSGNRVTNKQYPTTYLQFRTPPEAGKVYTLTVRVDAPSSKTGVVVQVRNSKSLGALKKVSEGIYTTTFVWDIPPQEKPYELVIYQPPNNGVEASLVWAKFVEGEDTDYHWYPNYDEVSNVYSFAEEASVAIESGANLLERTFAEKQGVNEFLSYADIAPVIDRYGVGKYTLSFELKAKTEGNMSVYISGTGKYTFLQEVIPVTTEYQRIALHLDMSKNVNSAPTAVLSFYGGKYGNGVIPTVRRLRLSKGIYTSLPWKPSDNELTGLYEKMMG